MNMEPNNHPTEKENHLNQTSILGFHVNFPGCTCFGFFLPRYINLGFARPAKSQSSQANRDSGHAIGLLLQANRWCSYFDPYEFWVEIIYES